MEPEIFDIKYDWYDDKWELIVYVKSTLLGKNEIYKKIYNDEESVENGKYSLREKLSSLKDGKVKEALLEFGMEIEDRIK